MNRLDVLGREHAGRHATKFIADWLCRAENQGVREQIRGYAQVVPDPGTAIRMSIMGQIAPLPVLPGDQMEFLVEAIQTMFAVIDWVEVNRQVKEAGFSA